MPKNLNDIKVEKKGKKVNLKRKTEFRALKDKIRLKKTPSLYKKNTSIKEVQDISGSKPLHFLYIRGKKFTPPKFLGDLMKLAGIGFLILIFINAINIYYSGKALEREISGTAFQGYSYLIDAGKSATKIEFDQAVNAFDNALANFSQAEKSLWFINTDNSFYAKDAGMAHAVDSLLEGGKYFAVAGGYFLEALEEFNKIPLYFIAKNEGEAEKIPSITDTMSQGLEQTNLAIEQINLATEEINSVNESSLPPEISSRLKLAKQQVREVSDALNSTVKHFPALLKMLGDRYPHRYLILLQNNREVRPTGGFIGSYAIMDMNEGYIEKLEVHDVYDIDGSFWGHITPPDELADFTKNWRFRDSNYHPDFTISAAKARWFLQKEGGPTVDTVIAINQGLLKDLLDITGPIQVGEFGKLNSSNYNLLLSFIIEGKVWGEEDPKHILKVFIPEFKKAIMKEENLAKLSSKLYRAVQQKHIMVWSSDEEIQGLLDAAGLSGRMHETTEGEDYLSVIHAATGGTKSEQFIEEKITHHTYIEKDGEIINEVTISRFHGWTDDIYYQWKKVLNAYGFTNLPDEIIDILGRGENKVSTRIYVPEGSELLEASKDGVQVMQDNLTHKTYFFTNMEVSEGETDTLTIKYRLPFKMDFEPAGTYKLVIEKQPGSYGSIFTKTVEADEGVEALAIYPAEARLTNDSDVTYATNLVYNRYFSSLWQK